MTHFIEVTVGSHVIVHGFDDSNKEIIEQVPVEPASKKLIAVDRILSVSENYILTSYIQGRLIYWEYQDDYTTLKSRLGAISDEPALP